MSFSTACVYPFVPVDGPGASEATPATPPSGDYANSCVGRERMFEYGSRKYGTPGRAVRLSYAIDMRYGVLHDVATAVHAGVTLDLTMGHADVIWQGDANDQSLRLLAHCTTPTTPINITGPSHTSIRWLAQEFGRRLGRTPEFSGTEAPTAWLVDTSESQRLFGQPRVPMRADDRLGRRLGRGGRSQPGQADAFFDPRWQVLTAPRPRPFRPTATPPTLAPSASPTCPAAWRCHARRTGTRTKRTGG